MISSTIKAYMHNIQHLFYFFKMASTQKLAKEQNILIVRKLTPNFLRKIIFPDKISTLAVFLCYYLNVSFQLSIYWKVLSQK